MIISGKTATYAIIGDPISQALSPIIHNPALKVTNKDAVFVGFQVKKENLYDAVQGIKALGIKGIAVTMPHKHNIIKYLDEIDPFAQELEAVNLITVKNGKLKGYNTDGYGFTKALESNDIFYKNKEVFLLGAGGAARGIANALLKQGIKKLYVCNLFPDEAEAFISDLSKFNFVPLEYVPFDKNKVTEACLNVSLIINATSLGMSGKPQEHINLFDWDNLPSRICFADIVHSPIQTMFIKKALSLDHKVMTGDSMLLYQGVIAYELLFNEKAPIEVMQKELNIWLKSE